MQQNNRPILIGITGSIGSGKTTFCKLLEPQFDVYYTDKLAHQIINEIEVKNILIQRWGEGILKNNEIDRDAVANIVYKDTKELSFLNSIIHPKVLEQLQKIATSSSDDVIFIEVPLLFETKMEQCFDFVIMISSIIEERVKRIKIRDNLALEKIYAIISKQISDDSKIKSADHVVYNNNDLAYLKQQADLLVQKVYTLSKRRTIPFTCILNH